MALPHDQTIPVTDTTTTNANSNDITNTTFLSLFVYRCVDMETTTAVASKRKQYYRVPKHKDCLDLILINR